MSLSSLINVQILLSEYIQTNKAIHKQVRFKIETKILLLIKSVFIMRKINYLFIALLAMLVVASCAKDDTLSADRDGNEAMVSFKLNVPSGLQTRAIGDGGTVDQLVYAVYYKGEVLVGLEGAEASGQFVVDAFGGAKQHTINLSLLKGKEYSIAFWAQTKGTGYYDTDDLTAVEVDYIGDNNDESRDAFFGAHTFTVATDIRIEATLKRPFAQLNVGVTQRDFDNATAAGLLVAQSRVVIRNVATKINLLSGATSGSEMLTYDSANIPSNPDTLVVNIDDSLRSYKYLSMSYFLVNDGGSADGTMKANITSLRYDFFNADNSESVTLKKGLNEVPVRRNYRTNIVGKLLTNDIEFNVTIDEIFDGNINDNDSNTLLPYGTYLATSEEELYTALAKNDVRVVLLGNDISLTEALVLDKKVTIDGQNFSFDKTVDITADNVTLKNLVGTPGVSTLGGSSMRAFVVGSKTGVVFDNVSVTASGQYGIVGRAGSEFEVKNSTFENLIVAIYGNLLHASTTAKLTANNNTIKNVLVGIGGTDNTILSVTNNTFVDLKAGGEGVGIGANCVVDVPLLLDNNNFDNIGALIPALNDYSSGSKVSYDKDGNVI